MNISMEDRYIPGSIIPRSSMNGVTGLEFIDKIFFMSKGIMLSRIRELAGIDGSTIQNWVKRGWIGNTVNKHYSRVQFARILIINMLRATMKLEKIDFLLHYINGNLDCRADDIISEPILFDYICRIVDTADKIGTVDSARLRSIIDSRLPIMLSGCPARAKDCAAHLRSSFLRTIRRSFRPIRRTASPRLRRAEPYRHKIAA